MITKDLVVTRMPEKIRDSPLRYQIVRDHGA